MIREKRFHATAHPRDPLWTMGDAQETLVVVAPAPAAAPGLAISGSLTIAALKKVVVSICNDDAESLELGKLNAYSLYTKSDMFETMLEESTVTDHKITFKLPASMDVDPVDVDTFDRMLQKKEWAKHFYLDDIFDRFAAVAEPKKRIDSVDVARDTALSVGVLRLIDFFGLEDLRERIIHLTNKAPTTARTLALDDAYGETAKLSALSIAKLFQAMEREVAPTMLQYVLNELDDISSVKTGAIRTTRKTLYELNLSWDAMATLVAIATAVSSENMHCDYGCLVHKGPSDQGRAMPQ